MADECVEREKVLDLLERYDKDTAMREIKRLPAANVRQVVHGYWKPLYDTDADRQLGKAMKYECSACGRVSRNYTDYRRLDYELCPYCGAVMDLKDGEQADLSLNMSRGRQPDRYKDFGIQERRRMIVKPDFNLMIRCVQKARRLKRWKRKDGE